MIKHLAFETYIHEYLQEAGVTAQVLGQQVPLTSISRHTRLQRLASFAIDQTREPLLGLIIGQRITNTAYGILGHALINCQSLLESQQFLLKHIWVWQENPANDISLTLDNHSLYLNYDNPPEWPRHKHFLRDLFFSSNLKRARELVGNDIEGARLELSRKPPADKSRYVNLLKLPVEFGTKADRLIFPRKIAEAPLPKTSTLRSKAYLAHCENLLIQLQAAPGLTAQVRLALVHSGKTRLKETHMADKLNISVRTLKRRLKSEGTSYRTIQQEIQNHLAQSYLLDTVLSVADIANLLGYFDSSTFSRAFKQWTGLTPPQFKQTR